MLRSSLATQALHAPLSPTAGVLRHGPRSRAPRRRAAPACTRRAAQASQSPYVPALPPAPALTARRFADVLSVALPAPVASAQLPALNSVPASVAILAGFFAFGNLLSTWRSGWSATRSRFSSGEHLRRATDARAPIAVFHDLENCAVPSAVQAWSVAGAVLEALRASGYGGVLRSYTAFGDMALLRTAVRRQLSSTGVRLCDVPSGRKDAADRALLLDMLLFARDTPPPAVVLLITGDRDFAPTAHRLTQLGYTVLLSAPLATATVAPELLSAAHRRFDWASMACGLVPFEERERERSGASGDDDEPDASPIGPLVGQAGSSAEDQPSNLNNVLIADGDYRFGRGRGARVSAFVSAAAAAIEREDVDELSRVVASAQLSGLKTTREAALLADLRRRLKQRGAAAEDVSADLERAISAADPQLAASAVLAARTRGVSRMLATQVAIAERIVRENRAARRGSRSSSVSADADDEDDEDDEDDDDGDLPVTGAEALGAVAPSHLDRSGGTHRRASAALKEHRLSSRRRLVLSEIDAPDAWAGRPWIASGMTPIPPGMTPVPPAAAAAAAAAAETVSLPPPPAADDPQAHVAAYESNPAVPRWFVTALRIGFEGQDFAILSSVIARGAASNVDTSGAASILAVVSRVRSVAGSLVRLALTRKMLPLQSLVNSLTDLPVEALLTKEIAEARDALARMLATTTPSKPPQLEEADDSVSEAGQYKERIREALDEEDPTALRAALLDAVICTNVVYETALRRLKVLTVAHECIPELQRAIAAGDLAVLRARILRVRRDFVAREPRRSFPATEGKLLAALVAAVEHAELALAELSASDAAARGDAVDDEGERNGGDDGQAAGGSAAVAEPSAVVA